MNLKYYHGNKYRKSYFEGWFFKHSIPYFNIAFIPSMAIDEKGEYRSFIQVVSDQFSHTFTFPYQKFQADEKNLNISISENTFSEHGIHLSLHDDEYDIAADITYGPFVKLKNDIMGFFAKIPFMECYHAVYSMRHDISGSLSINSQVYDLAGGTGYIESDYGTSFPSKYLWIQCNRFDKNGSFFFSRAVIPFLKTNFNGFICSFIHEGREHRFATYNHAKVISAGSGQVVITKGHYKLIILYEKEGAKGLKAPVTGRMERIIHESLNGKCKVILFRDGEEIAILSGTNAGIEDEM
jgi:hypothetical protein